MTIFYSLSYCSFLGQSQKRSVQQSTYFTCKPTSFQRVLASCKRTGKDIKPSNCQITANCVFTITCYHFPLYVCSGFIHQSLRVCCNYVCSDWINATEKKVKYHFFCYQVKFIWSGSLRKQQQQKTHTQKECVTSSPSRLYIFPSLFFCSIIFRLVGHTAIKPAFWFIPVVWPQRFGS